MLTSMGIAAFCCVFIGVNPGPLYNILPYPVTYAPYTGAHVIGQLQLLLFGIFAFFLLLRSGYYPSEVNAVNLDTDWFYRKFFRRFERAADQGLNGLNRLADGIFAQGLAGRAIEFSRAGAARLALFFLAPVLVLVRANGGIETCRHKLEEAMETGTAPTGISAAAAVLFLVLIYLLA